MFVRDDFRLDSELHAAIGETLFEISATCGNEAVKESAKQHPDLILLNLLLHDRNGFNILRQLKENMQTQHIPVIILTKMNTQPYWDEAYRIGASAYAVLGEHDQYLFDLIKKQLTPQKELIC